MKRILLFAVSILFIIGISSGYGVYVNCTNPVTIGTTIKCAIDSDFPVGTTFNLIFSNPQNELDRQTIIIPTNKNTQYKLFDTTGLPGGAYSIDIKFSGMDQSYLRSDSIIHQDINLVGEQAIITGATTIPSTTIIPTATSIPATTFTTIPQTLTTTSPPSTAISPVTSSPTVSPAITINGTPTKSVEELIKEQNEKIDAQNTLIAEQNQKLESQNGILNQILAELKGIFGWK